MAYIKIGGLPLNQITFGYEIVRVVTVVWVCFTLGCLYVFYFFKIKKISKVRVTTVTTLTITPQPIDLWYLDENHSYLYPDNCQGAS
jgi:hypothetical protein